MQAGWSACASAHVRDGQTLVVGLSGGVDSVSLLHWLTKNLPAGRYPLRAVHVHHGLSPNADAWADACQRICDALDVPLSVVRVVVQRKSKDGLEGAARRARHAAFDQAGGDWIVLAHHRGDQAETLLFNLLRGTGLAGVAAMASRQRRFLRPWLSLSRREIDAYAREHNLGWIEDESNRDIGISRNFLRHEILVPASQRFPAAERTLAAAAGRFAEATTLLDELATLDLAAEGAEFPIPVSVLSGLSEPRARNVLRYLLARRGVRIPSETRLIELLRQVLAAGPDRHPRVRFGDWDIVRHRGRIDLERAS